MTHKVTGLMDGIRLLSGVKDECCIYIVEGSASALVVDTGFGTCDLRAEIEALTPLPYKVVNTHGHGDHSGGDMYFDRVYMLRGAEPDARAALELNRTKLSAEEAAKVESRLREGSFSAEHISGGHVFELGGKTVEVIEIPGHTSGCAALLDREDRVVFSGDCVVKAMDILLVVPQALSLSTYAGSMKRLWERQSEFDFLCTGHDECLVPKSLLGRVIGLCEDIISGAVTGEPIELPPVFGDTHALRADGGDFAVAYRPGRI